MPCSWRVKHIIISFWFFFLQKIRVGHAKHAVNGTSIEIPCDGTLETSAERCHVISATFARRTFTIDIT